jgi:hypothetical protein
MPITEGFRLDASRQLFFDIPVCKRVAGDLVKRNAMKMVSETARIYKGSSPQLPLEDIYGITSG